MGAGSKWLKALRIPPGALLLKLAKDLLSSLLKRADCCIIDCG